MRSGLAFAGANHAWAGEEIPLELDDGILTAYEVSGMYLPNTKLVVLSACETGLGEIKGSEGVFGLQRSFKIAGTEYILMSLWQIPDYQTSELMNRFYTEWFSGKPIQESLKAAQDFMKGKYPLQPFMWAGFVLVR
jgi:CHAT domain-containing protein